MRALTRLVGRFGGINGGLWDIWGLKVLDGTGLLLTKTLFAAIDTAVNHAGTYNFQVS